tara:strand:- start:401 stop:1201 length:801 start_codon:yes stop_codon:yes gene_type:complete
MIKKFLVIGNPIDHSLSPKLHNYWINKNNINAVYDKKKINDNDIKDIISEVKEEKICGINVTVPFKKSVISFLDELSPEANETQSVNTIYVENKKTIGHNTDIAGFELGIRYSKYNIKNKTIFILGAGGVAPSIIVGLKKMKAEKIILCNRTKQKALDLKERFKELEIVNWGDMPPEANVIINATSIGLNENDDFQLDFTKLGKGKLFYDLIYNPTKTNFLKKAKTLGNQIENGKMMFIYQAHQAFTIWHKVMPTIDDATIKILDV